MAKINNKSKISSWLPIFVAMVVLAFIKSAISQRAFITLTVAGSFVFAIGAFVTSRMLWGDNYSKATKIANKIFVTAGMLCVVGTVFTGFIYSFIDGSKMPFWGISLIIGLALGIAFTINSMKKNKTFLTPLVGIVIAALLMFLSSAYISHFNYLFDNSEPAEVQGIILDKEFNSHRKSPDEYIFELEIDGRKIKVDVTQGQYNKYKEGDIYTLKKYNGAFDKPFYVSEQ